MGLGNVKVALIRESEVALRSVNRQAESYLQLVESIRKVGVLNSITVRPDVDGLHYILVDGLQRLTATRDAGLEEIPANVIDTTDDVALLQAQIIANIHKIETRPVEYSKQLLRILAANPLMTCRELASSVAQSEGWVNQRLGLLKLDSKIGELVDAGSVNLSNAYALAKLPVEEQASFVDRAMTDTPQTFIPTVHARVKQIRDAKSQGKDAAPAEFHPVAYMRKLTELKAEFESPNVTGVIVASEGASTAEEGFRAALAWVLNMDKLSVVAQKTKDDERKAKRAAETEKRKEERQKQKDQEAAQKAASLETL